MQRSTIVAGPGIVIRDGVTWHTKGDIEIQLGFETFDIETSVYGKVDRRAMERIAKVIFEPAGEVEELAKQFPYGSFTFGASIFTGTDVPLVIHGADQTKITMKASAMTKIPDIILSSTKTFAGSIEFTCIGADNTAWDAADSLMTIATGQAFPALSFDPANVLTQPYTAAWADPVTPVAPWDSFETLDGFVVSQALETFPVTIDSAGQIDLRFASLEVTAKATPIGITEAQLLTAMRLQGAGNKRGRSLGASQWDLKITGTGLVVTVKQAAIRDGGYHFDHRQQRIRAVEWVATRKLDAGVLDPLITVATS